MDSLALGQLPDLRADLTALRDNYSQRSGTMAGRPSADLFRRGHAVNDFIDAAFNRATSRGGYLFRNANLERQADVLSRYASRAASDARQRS
ncbi:hypothetical protein [Actinoplanes sp. CA-252034]|uniref:hypothetical protein n=1 Tax=Actinoplanes sp. CA-252034 TaxID=3239906 RepID=UPI003D971301